MDNFIIYKSHWGGINTNVLHVSINLHVSMSPIGIVASKENDFEVDYSM